MTLEIIIALVSTAFSSVAVVVGFLMRWVLITTVKRIELLEKSSAETISRLHVNDVETVKLQGRIALVEASHNELDRDIHDLKNAVQSGFRDVNSRLDQIMRPTSGQRYPAAYSPPPESPSKR